MGVTMMNNITTQVVHLHSVQCHEKDDNADQTKALERMGFSVAAFPKHERDRMIVVESVRALLGQGDRGRFTVVCPEGWRFEYVDDMPWMARLVDAKRRFRGVYDATSLALDLATRFVIGDGPMGFVGSKQITVHDAELQGDEEDGLGGVVWRSDEIEPDNGNDSLSDYVDKCETIARAWLDANRPGWHDPSMYWS